MSVNRFSSPIWPKIFPIQAGVQSDISLASGRDFKEIREEPPEYHLLEDITDRMSVERNTLAEKVIQDIQSHNEWSSTFLKIFEDDISS